MQSRLVLRLASIALTHAHPGTLPCTWQRSFPGSAWLAAGKAASFPPHASSCVRQSEASSPMPSRSRVARQSQGDKKFPGRLDALNDSRQWLALTGALGNFHPGGAGVRRGVASRSDRACRRQSSQSRADKQHPVQLRTVGALSSRQCSVQCPSLPLGQALLLMSLRVIEHGRRYLWSEQRRCGTVSRRRRLRAALGVALPTCVE